MARGLWGQEEQTCLWGGAPFWVVQERKEGYQWIPGLWPERGGPCPPLTYVIAKTGLLKLEFPTQLYTVHLQAR